MQYATVFTVLHALLELTVLCCWFHGAHIQHSCHTLSVLLLSLQTYLNFCVAKIDKDGGDAVARQVLSRKTRAEHVATSIELQGTTIRRTKLVIYEYISFL